MAKQTFTLQVHGMHCQACVLLTESELREHPKVSSAKSNLRSNSVRISGDFGTMTLEQIAKELNKVLSEHTLSVNKEVKARNWRDFIIAIPIALAFILLFFMLQKLGIVNLVSAGNVTYGTAFTIGVVASLSTCMAVVGGLLLSLSATFARSGDRVRPQVLFHAGRLISFFILGAVIGTIGSAFQLGSLGTFILSLLVGLVMLLLGLNLLDLFHWTKSLQPTIPNFLSSKVLNVTKLNHTLTPALVGLATFFLPCGFTQSMQIYTLSTGSFLQGGLTMLAYALGTLPVLALLSFSSFSIRENSQAGVFFKSAGLIVILFALYNITNSLVAIGWFSPIFNF